MVQVPKVGKPPRVTNRGSRLMSGAYEAADRSDRMLALWNPLSQSADQDVLPNKSSADARALDLSRNDSYVAGGIRLHKDAIVGARYMLNAKPKHRILGQDDVWAQEFSEEVEEKFTLWAESSDCWPDAARRSTFTELVRLAVGVYVTSGEFLATVEWRSREEERPYFTAIQPVEPNRLSTPLNRVGRTDQDVRGGIRLSASGRPLGYFIRRRERGVFGGPTLVEQFQWSYVRAHVSRFGPLSRRPQVIHIVEQDRPSQTRGISQLVSALKQVRMCQRFRDITLQNAAINASFAAAIESELPSDLLFQALGSGNVDDQSLESLQSYMGAIAEYSDGDNNIKLDGAKIPHLFPGSKLNLTPAGTVGGIGTEFENSFLRYMASSLGVSYEELSKDFKEVSYSGARAVLNQTARHMKARKRFVADRFASTVYRLWLEEAYNADSIETMRGRPSFYEGMNPEAYTYCEWLGAGLDPIEALKEIQAVNLKIKAGLSTYEHELAKLGLDYRHVFQQIAVERNLMRDLEITPNELMTPEELAVTGDGEGDGSGDGDGNGNGDDD